MESKDSKSEIILSNETKNLTSFSSTNLIARGQKLADLLLLKNPLMEKVEKCLLKEFSEINDKSKHTLYHKTKLAIALLEIQNKSTESWAISVLNEESEKPGDLTHILYEKKDILQVLSKMGKQKVASEYILEQIRKLWRGTGFSGLLGWIFNIVTESNYTAKGATKLGK